MVISARWAAAFVVSLCLSPAAVLRAQEPPPSKGWEVEGTIEIRFARSVPASEVSSRTIRIFHQGAEVQGALAYDPFTATALFRPDRPFDTRHPFTWELGPGLAPLLLAAPQWFGPRPCDVAPDTDDDLDGLPDCSEMPGTFYDGVPIHAYGARRGRPDLFIEIDFMRHSTKPWITPKWEALERVRRAFERRGYFVHFDAGGLFGGAYLDPVKFNLGGGDSVPYTQQVAWASPSPSCANGWTQFPPVNFLNHYRANYFTANRGRSFYYVLFADTVNGWENSGVAHNSSTNAVISFGHAKWGQVFNPADPNVTATMRKNQVINYQAGTLMHEFGHQLSLREGGFDQIGRKPNYISVMNYPYQIFGLPHIGGAVEGDRYHLDVVTQCANVPMTKVQLDRGPYGDWQTFPIDYSDGTSLPLDESNLVEAAGLGRVGSTPVDWNCNGVIDAQPVQKEINGGGGLVVLPDHDDWGAIELYHRKWFASGEEWPNAGLAFACPFP